MKAKKGINGKLVIQVEPFELIQQADRHLSEIKLIQVARKTGIVENWLSTVVVRRLSLQSGIDKIQQVEYVALVEKL